MSKINKLIGAVQHPLISKVMLGMVTEGYLKSSGWVDSLIAQKPVDINGDPQPWLTLPFISFIKDRLSQSMSIFEYGSGNSTLFYSNYVHEIYAVEHDKEWYETVQKNIKDSVRLIYCNLEYDGEYCRTSQKVDKKFNIIIVDGRDRVNCLKQSVDSLTDDGCIVLDDSERERYEEGVKFLLDKGFRKLDFWGVSLGVTYNRCTTLFYKDNNCLGV